MSDLTLVAVDRPGDFWKAIGCRAVGAAIVTTSGPARPEGFLALSASHLCASPPLMTVALDGATSAGVALRETGAFCINYLAQDQRAILDRFLRRDGPKGTARFEGITLDTLRTGAPAIPGCVGLLDCQVEEIIERHATSLVIGRLILACCNTARAPLVSYAGSFA